MKFAVIKKPITPADGNRKCTTLPSVFARLPSSSEFNDLDAWVNAFVNIVEWIKSKGKITNYARSFERLYSWCSAGITDIITGVCTRLQLTNISLLSLPHSDKLVLSTEIIMADPDGFEEQKDSKEIVAVVMALCHLGPSSSELLQTENAFSSISL